MAELRYRLLDTDGRELGIVVFEAPVGLGDPVTLPDGSVGRVVDVFKDENGREGGVEATLAVDA